MIEPTLASLKIGELELVPNFSADILSYTLKTSNATNIVRAEAIKGVRLQILVNGEAEESGTSVRWKEGLNNIEIIVSIDELQKKYKIEVIKEL